MNPRRFSIGLLSIAGLIVLADELIKRWALTHLPMENETVHANALSFSIHKNWGIAFDIPFKMPLIILISALIGISLLWVAYRDMRAKPFVALSALMIVLGACGNLYDRLAYGYTVDYVILFGRSAVNLSDAVIVSGVILLLIASRDANASVDNLEKT